MNATFNSFITTEHSFYVNFSRDTILILLWAKNLLFLSKQEEKHFIWSEVNLVGVWILPVITHGCLRNNKRTRQGQYSHQIFPYPLKSRSSGDFPETLYSTSIVFNDPQPGFSLRETGRLVSNLCWLLTPTAFWAKASTS